MPEDQQFTPREISRLINSVDALTGSIESLRREMAETYVRKDVYSSDRAADAAEGDQLSRRMDKQESYWSRLAWTVGLSVLTALLALVVGVNGGTLA